MAQARTKELHCTENKPDLQYLCYSIVGQLTDFKGKGLQRQSTFVAHACLKEQLRALRYSQVCVSALVSPVQCF